eukprot:SAG11_NODE_35397_length_266_cov_3.323353_1_plen_48_part_01
MKVTDVAAMTLLRLSRSRQRGGKRPKEDTPSALGVAGLGWKRGDWCRG